MEFFAVILMVLIGLSLPSAWRWRSWKRFFIALPLVFFGVLLPLFFFGMSAFLVPEWKGGCRLGWLDCFHLGKLALTPVALWATAALYAVDVYKVTDRHRPWIVHGIFTGALVALGCLVFGLVSVGCTKSESWLLLVPFYVAVWYGIRAVQLIQVARPGAGSLVCSFGGTLPLWIGGLFWSRRIFESLPNNPPSCFVVTAASHGHRKFVGPFAEVRHRGRVRQANLQLITLWQFEALWQICAPRSHRTFRRAYNRIGPILARQISSPLLADLTYVAIKPVELLAGLVVKTAQENKRRTVQVHGGIANKPVPLCEHSSH